MFLVDSHCHLDLLDLTECGGNISHVLERAQKQGVQHFLNVCVKITDFPAVLQAAETYPFVSATVGLHPNEQEEEVTQEVLLQLGQHQKVIAIGETGLDYYRSTGDLSWQQDRFRVHVRAARELKKPLIIHTRHAKHDTLQLMREERADQVGGIMHCFTEDWDAAQQALEMNFYISFSGIVTFKNAEALQAVAKQVPLNRLLIETDAPYLAPGPMRGKPNEPAYVHYTAEYIAKLRDVPLAELAEQTTQNFFTLFTGAIRHV